MALALTVMAASAPLGGDSGRPSVLCGGAGLGCSATHQVLLSLVAQQEAARGWRALGVTLAAPFCGAFLSVSSSPPASSHSAGWLLEPLSLCSLGRGLAVQRLGPRALTAGGTGSSPVGGTKILHALRRGQKKKKRERERLCSLPRSGDVRATGVPCFKGPIPSVLWAFGFLPMWSDSYVYIPLFLPAEQCICLCF